MRQSRLALIFCGHGEGEALPILIQRVVRLALPDCSVNITDSFRENEDRLRRPKQLERYVELAARKLRGEGGILILLDCDWDNGCPKKDGPALLQRARTARPDMPISVVLAYKEYESWFLAAAESLRGKFGLPKDLESVEDPEKIRGAKEWLRKRMPGHHPYSTTEHQAAFTRELDIQMARRTPSFDKCFREIVQIVDKVSR